MSLEELLGAALALPVDARARLVREIQLSIVEDSHTDETQAPVKATESDSDPELTAELQRRLSALQRGEAQTVSREEMKLRLASRRASRASS